MCWWLKVNGTYCDTIGELRKAIYPDSDKIVYDPLWGDTRELAVEKGWSTSCLCPVDMNKTAAALGMTVAQHDGGDYEFVKPPSAA